VAAERFLTRKDRSPQSPEDARARTANVIRNQNSGYLRAKSAGNIFGSQVIYQLRQVRQESSIVEFGTNEIET
jgi:hypothetical protein